MAFSADLDDPVSRIRFAVGDTDDPPQLPGAEPAYEALLRAAGYDVLQPEAVVQRLPEEIATRSAAAALGAYLASQPDRISDSGSSVAWSERVAQLNRIALGQAGSTTAAATPTSSSAPRAGRLTAGSDFIVR